MALGALACLAAPAAAVGPSLTLQAVLTTPVPIEGLTLAFGPDRDPMVPLMGASSACQASFFHPHPAAHSFRFQEGSTQRGCLGVVHNVTLPEGTRRIHVLFTANRTVQQEGGILQEGMVAMHQELRLWVDAAVAATFPYFGPEEPSRGARPFQIAFEVPHGTTRIRLEWWFADRGSLASPGGLVSPARLEAFGATVWDPVVRVDDLALDPPPARSHAGQFRGEAYLASYELAVDVPDGYRQAAIQGRVALALQMPGHVVVSNVMGPDGADLETGLYQSILAAGQRSLVLPGPTLQAHGPGPYRVEILVPEPLQPAPAMATMAAAAVAAPPLAIALAAWGLRRRRVDRLLRDHLEGERDGR